ncbi:MAG: DUF983 domain-containing protein [Crocinitomicaceae bacterium]
MDYKSSKIYSILNNRCPICHEGEVFSHKIYDIKNFHKMHERCSVCNHKYEIEPGFFIGAMYVSYGITVAISVVASVLTYLISPDAPYYMYMITISLGIILIMPFTYRISRLTWINMFSNYNPKVKQP